MQVGLTRDRAGGVPRERHVHAVLWRSADEACEHVYVHIAEVVLTVSTPEDQTLEQISKAVQEAEDYHLRNRYADMYI